MNYQAFVLMIILYGISTYFHGHQGSHLTYIKEGHQRQFGRVTLNPLLILILQIYNITMLPWLVLIIIGITTVWFYPIIIILFSQIVRFSLTGIEMRLKVNGALISLTGIFVIPVTLYFMYLLSQNL